MNRCCVIELTSSPSTLEIDRASWPYTGLESVELCPVCGSASRELLYSRLRDRVFFCAPGEWELYGCVKCGTGFLDPRPNAATIGLAYSSYFTHNSAGDVGATPRSWWRRRR